MMTNHRGESLWVPIVAPVIWAVHFLACYAWVALACGRLGDFDQAHRGIIALTVVASVAIAVCLWYGFHRHDYQLPDRSNDDGTSEDRRQFMAVTTMLLAGLSLIATIFAGAAAVVGGGCL